MATLSAIDGFGSPKFQENCIDIECKLKPSRQSQNLADAGLLLLLELAMPFDIIFLKSGRPCFVDVETTERTIRKRLR